MQSATMELTMDSARDRFQALLAQHEKIVFKVANTYYRDVEDRRDLAQDICVQAWRSFGGYDAARPFATWLYRVALNVAISSIRSAGRRRRNTIPLNEGFLEVADTRPTSDEPDERVRVLHAVIDRLDALNRALMLLYLEDRSYRDIAYVLGLTETNVATKLNRLKQRIRAELADNAR